MEEFFTTLPTTLEKGIIVRKLFSHIPQKVEDKARDIIFLFIGFSKMSDLGVRARWHEVGIAGNSSTDSQRLLAEEKGLKPLSSFERWLLDPYIKYDKELRRGAHRQYMESMAEKGGLLKRMDNSRNN